MGMQNPGNMGNPHMGGVRPPTSNTGQPYDESNFDFM